MVLGGEIGSPGFVIDLCSAVRWAACCVCLWNIRLIERLVNKSRIPCSSFLLVLPGPREVSARPRPTLGEKASTGGVWVEFNLLVVVGGKEALDT